MGDTPAHILPEKSYYTIGEVAAALEVAPHVLRYWEKEFTQINPVKRAGNRRFYQRRDIELLFEIRSLLYERGFTIAGARQHLKLKATDPTELLRILHRELCDLHALLTARNSPADPGPTP